VQLAYFWEQEDAEAVAELLDGEVRRGRFHGEDDDEDHPWIVELTAGEGVERVVAAHDGWLETATDAPSGAPVPLPQEPKRFKK
jgi:hypothetical protein